MTNTVSTKTRTIPIIASDPITNSLMVSIVCFTRDHYLHQKWAPLTRWILYSCRNESCLGRYLSEVVQHSFLHSFINKQLSDALDHILDDGQIQLRLNDQSHCISNLSPLSHELNAFDKRSRLTSVLALDSIMPSADTAGRQLRVCEALVFFKLITTHS